VAERTRTRIATTTGHHDHRHEHGEAHVRFVGKVAGLTYDRFGEFDGFILDTEEGRRRFEGPSAV
jgi:hypothetical protein